MINKRLDEINLKDNQKDFIKQSFEDLMLEARRKYYLCEGSEDEEECCPIAKSEFEAISSLTDYLGLAIDISFEC